MDRSQSYIMDSLEQHLFFARIMKEHAFFLKVGFLPPNAGLAQKGEHLMREFESLLSRTITLSDCVVRKRVLDSGEIFTEFTERLPLTRGFWRAYFGMPPGALPLCLIMCGSNEGRKTSR